MYYIAVFIALVYERLRERRLASGTSRLARHESLLEPIAGCGSLRAIVLSVACIVCLFAIRLVLIAYAAHDDRVPASVWHLPIPTVYDSHAFWTDPYRVGISICLAYIAIANSIALSLLHRTLTIRGPKPIDAIIITTACVLLALFALFAPALATSDPYLYAAYGELGLHAYGSHLLSVPCASPLPDAWCKKPVIPSLYGPLYLVYLNTLLRHVDSILLRIEILRLSNVLWVALCLFSLHRLGIGFPILTLAALNELLWAHYVGDAHNDIIGIALILMGSSIVQRYPFLALIFAISASLMKLPFILLGLLMFWPLPTRLRLLWALAALTFSSAASLLWGGRAYVDSMLFFSRDPQFFSTIEHRLLVIVAVALIAIALACRNIKLAGAYAIPVLGGASPHSWYTLWALPYIMWDSRKLTIFLIALPMTSFLLETPFQIPMLATTVVCVMTVLLLTTLRSKGT